MPEGVTRLSAVVFTTKEPLWKAPMSIAPTRANPRWSVLGAPVLVPASMAGLPACSGMVCVGPP